MQVFLAYTTSKAGTDVLLGSFPSQLAHPQTTCRYLETPMSTSRLVFVPLSSSSLLQRKLEMLKTLCLRGLQDLGLQKIFLGQTLLSSPLLPPWALCLCQIFWTFCFPPYMAAGVNTLFCDCIMIYVAFSEARIVLQRVWSNSCYIAKQESGPLCALWISIRTSIL